MITIFNKKLNCEIQIDESYPQITFTPRDYEEVPFIKIEIQGFNFLQHSRTCSDCKAFIDSFGTQTLDWFINYSDKSKRLDLFNFGKAYKNNHIKFKNSDDEYLSILKLNLSTIPTDRKEIEQLLKQDEVSENYERCCTWRDLLN
jgi:hypothetical protein